MESSNVGQIEKLTQARVVKLFSESLGYEYLGNWIDRTNNRNIESVRRQLPCPVGVNYLDRLTDM
ncbi:hypothetical protein [Methylobacter sp. S3L5C]|uniref:hypothetical protein n=1 Tax=Methylobacter sp. S3L5C TaxID=2839024 RepID=UPI001FACA2B2|nr:hypothetical protein [Methylobacter sp. S3L5C]UOA08011.1 hypothetical protein KKZ03_17470 [Methylobacter sp. S3L5C]